MRKIHIGLICENRSDVDRFISKNINCAQRGIDGKLLLEQEYFVFHHIKPYTSFHGSRMSQVYTDLDVAQSDWFRGVIRPMLVGEIGSINE